MTNYLTDINKTGVKFYASLTRRQAKGLDSIPTSTNVVVSSTTSAISGVSIYYNDSECSASSLETNPVWNGTNTYYYKWYKVEPGAICFVSDDEGNSIFLNYLLFGDGAKAGSGGGSGGGITEVTLDMIPVVTVDGEVQKNLGDYFDSEGKFITQGISITKTNGDGTTSEIISINSSGIKIGNDTVLTESVLDNYYTSTEVDTAISTAKEEAETYAKGLITSVYIVKGSVHLYSDLNAIKLNSNLDETTGVGWVYNVETANNTTPAGTNYVWNGTTWDPLGGTVDLSAYKTSADTDTAINNALTEAKNYTDTEVSTLANGTVATNTQGITNVNTRIDTLISGTITPMSTKVSTNSTNISTNTTNITNLSNLLTWQ